MQCFHYGRSRAAEALFYVFVATTESGEIYSFRVIFEQSPQNGSRI